jgi:hypothetical protein
MTDGPDVEPAKRPLPSPFQADAERIEEPLASALVAFGLDDVAPPDVHLPTCVSASAGPLRIENVQAELCIEGRSLVLTVPHRWIKRPRRLGTSAGDVPA